MKFATGKLGLTEMIVRAEIGKPFCLQVYGKADAHKIMRNAHVVAKRKGIKISTNIMRAVDISDYDYHSTIVRLTVLENDNNDLDHYEGVLDMVTGPAKQFTVEQLVQALVDVGLVDSEVFEYPDGYQDTLNRVGNLHALLAALTQEKQEPVAWMSPGKERLEFARPGTVYGSHTIPLYTHPPRREWVGLTADEIGEIERNTTEKLNNGGEIWHFDLFARAVEDALKEKNT